MNSGLVGTMEVNLGISNRVNCMLGLKYVVGGSLEVTKETGRLSLSGGYQGLKLYYTKG